MLYFQVEVFGEKVFVVDLLGRRYGWVTAKEERNLQEVIYNALCFAEIEIDTNRVCEALGIPPVPATFNKAIPLSDLIAFSKELQGAVKFAKYCKVLNRLHKEEEEWTK